MHALTKVLVVIGAFLSVLLAGLSVAYTANVDQVKQEFTQFKNQRVTAEARVNEINQQAAAERENAEKTMSDLRGMQTQLTAELASLQSENSRLQAQVASLEQAAALHAAQIDQFLATSETYAELNNKQSSELGQLRQKELDSARREIALTDRINELEGRLEVSIETSRSLQERIVELREDLDFARQGGTQVTAAEGGTLKAPVGFQAVVTGVRQDPAGSMLVEIDAGASDSLRENMKLNVVNEGGYIASAVVQIVDDNSSVLRITLIKPGREGDLRAGNLVRPTL
ncbi:MAG: hypothetical protein RLN60_05370 [Phycisphaerales bacterium]